MGVLTNELDAVDAALEPFLIGFYDFSGNNDIPDFGPLALVVPTLFNLFSSSLWSLNKSTS